MPSLIENLSQVDFDEDEARRLKAMGFITEQEDADNPGTHLSDLYETTALLWGDFNLPSEDQLQLIESVLLGLRA